MARILIGIPSVKPRDSFLVSLLPFLESLTDYDVDVFWVWNKPLVEAQNSMAMACLKGDYDYLLTLEDDHSGHTKEMVDGMIEADVPFIGIPYYSRHYPNIRIPMMKRGDKYFGARHESGVHDVDILGFGMTLIKREVFEGMDYPYFKVDKGSIRSTDKNFSKRVKAKGHFDYFLTHRELNQENILEKRFLEKFNPLVK